MSRTIPLSRGYVAVVDDQDYKWLSRWKWHAIGCDSYPYAARRQRACEIGVCGHRKLVYMHRAVVGLEGEDSRKADHENHDTLDNRRENLRVCTHSLNLANQISTRGRSRYKGVYWDTSRSKWKVYVGTSPNRRYLGLYHSEEDAARSYDEAARIRWGEFAYLNFPSC